MLFQALRGPHLMLIFRGHLLYLEAEEGLLGLLTAECSQWNTVLLVFSVVFSKTVGSL